MNYRSKYTGAEIEAALDKIINNVTDNDELATIIGNVNKRFDNYLPLTGGTINSGSGQVSLMLSSTGATTRIAFLKGETLLGYFAFAGVDTPQYITAAGREYDLFHEGNYVDLIGNTYLKTTGGTLTGNLTVPLLVLNGGMYLDTSGAKDLIVYDNTARRIVLHSGNYSHYALPLSGGTMEGLLEIKRDISVIRFTEGSTICGYLGVHGKDNPIFMTADGTGQTLLHSGNYSEYALPKTGGTIKSDSGYMLTLNRLSESPTLIAFQSRGVLKGFLGIGTDGTPVYLNNSAVSRPLLHSGNVGEYAIKKSRSINFDTELNTAGYGTTTTGWKYNGAAFIFGYDHDYKFALQSDHSNGKQFIEVNYHLPSGWMGWKTIAFTDSTVNKAKMLVNDSDVVYANFESQGYVRIGLPNTYNSTRVDGYSILFTTNNPSSNAMLINSSGNVTIGASDLAETDAKLAIDGRIAIFGSGNTEYPALLLSTAEYGLQIVAGLDENNQKLPIAFGWRNSLDIPMLINANGNVTIGSSDLAGTSAKLYVDGGLVVGKNSFIGVTDSNDKRLPALQLNNSNNTHNLLLGQYTAKEGYNTVIYGNEIKLCYSNAGTSSLTALLVNSSGNVTIGASDLAGDDYKLVVDGLSRFKNNVESDGNVIGGGAIQAKTSAHGFVSLQVGSTGNKGLLDSRTSWFIYTDGTNTFLPRGNVLIGTTNDNGAKLQVNGDISMNGTSLTDKLTELEQRLTALGG